MSYAIFIFLNILLIQLPFSNEVEVGCTYYTASGTQATTGDDYLKGSNEIENKQSCFSLSTASKKCCYNKDSSTNKETCVERDLSAAGPNCPANSVIHNNCGMALFYQPESKEACTEISLVNGYCCFVKTKAASNQGNACLKQDEIDEDEKDEITDYMKDYFRNRLGLNPDEVIAIGAAIKGHMIDESESLSSSNSN